MTETRKVLVSPGFGAGWSTWNSDHGKALATDPELVSLVERGLHRGRTPDPKDPGRFDEASKAFVDRAYAVAGADAYLYFGGVRDLQVQVVSGPFRIDEYDGSESLVEASEEVWW